MPEIKLTEVDLENALHYLDAAGQFMYLPDQFELKAIELAWDKVKPVLLSVNLLSYSPSPKVQLIAPKQKFAARPVQIIDPIDLVLLTALGLRLSPVIEDHRNRLGPDIVHSWRFTLDSEGRPTFTSDWDSWLAQVAARASSYDFVAKADIVDFYPRIYLHRLKNALTAICGTHETNALMRFFEKWANGTSYGIPIGPRICGILAEAVLSEVDEFLLSLGFDFVRYVDDYIFFGKSYSACMKALFMLAQRLQETQGLCLNMAKTKILSVKKFSEELISPAAKSAKSRRKVINEVFGGDPYAVKTYENLNPQQKRLIDSLDLTTSLKEALKPDLIDLPMVKFVLNVLAGLKRPELVHHVLDSLDVLLPVAEAVSRFISIFAAEQDAIRQVISSRIMTYIQETPFVPSYYILWLLEPFVHDAIWNHLADLRNIARDNREFMVRRQAILAIGKIGDRSSLLDLRHAIAHANEWEWRAIVYASRSLPKDEREAFWRSLDIPNEWKLPNLTKKATLEYAKAAARG
ncbi:MAG: RNA-directed DNA polymerase [Thermodesulfobacteriota bacterium]